MNPQKISDIQNGNLLWSLLTSPEIVQSFCFRELSDEEQAIFHQEACDSVFVHTDKDSGEVRAVYGFQGAAPSPETPLFPVRRYHYNGVVVVEPYEQKRADFIEERAKNLPPSWAESKDPQWVRHWKGNVSIAHRSHVTQALKRGITVADEVLVDYPGLKEEIAITQAVSIDV